MGIIVEFNSNTPDVLVCDINAMKGSTAPVDNFAVLSEPYPCGDCGLVSECERDCKAFTQYASTGKWVDEDVAMFKAPKKRKYYVKKRTIYELTPRVKKPVLSKFMLQQEARVKQYGITKPVKRAQIVIR